MASDLCSLFQLVAIELRKSINNPQVLAGVLAPDILEKYMKTCKTFAHNVGSLLATIFISTELIETTTTLDGKIWSRRLRTDIPVDVNRREIPITGVDELYKSVKDILHWHNIQI